MTLAECIAPAAYETAENLALIAARTQATDRQRPTSAQLWFMYWQQRVTFTAF
jgi:hypothetical protein